MPGLVLISGQPRCGKSHAGRALATFFGGDHFAVSDYLKDLTHRHYGLPASMSADAFEETKDVARPEFGGKTPRQAYIHVSEKIIKPRYGESYLGGLAAERLRTSLFPISIVSGVGFKAEVLPLINVAGAHNALHIRVTPVATGLPAPEDSRERLDLTEFGVQEADVVNEFTPAFRDELRSLVAERFEAEFGITCPAADLDDGRDRLTL